MKKIHGQYRSPEHNSWSNMKQRCYDKNHNRFYRYGGRGIKVCDRWLHSFENFLSDMGAKPTSKHTLERKNINGNYEPENCEWATQKEQQNNRSNNAYFTANGKTQSIEQWSAETGIKYRTIMRRIKYWHKSKVLTVPPRKWIRTTI